MQHSTPEKQQRYRQLLQRHRTLIFGVCYGHSKEDRELTHDMVQETCIRLWEHLERLRPDCHPLQEKAWVYWQARSVCDLVRRRQRPMVGLEAADGLAASTDPDPTGHRELLHTAIAKLPERDRTLVGLYLDGYGFAAIADRLGSTSAAVNKQMQRIRAKIKQIVQYL